MEPGRLFLALMRHKKKAIWWFLLFMGAVSAFTVFGPRAYLSQAKLLVRLGRENATLDATTTLGNALVVAVPQNRENDINSLIEIIKSRILLDKVVAAIGAEVVLQTKPLEENNEPRSEARNAPGNDTADLRYKAMRKLASGLTVEAVKKANIITLSYEASNPELAQVVLTKLIGFSLDHHVQLQRAPGANEFLAEQANRLRQKLVHCEQELKESKNKMGISFPDSQGQILVNRIGRLEDELLQTTSNMVAIETEVRLLNEKLAGLSKTHVTAQTQGMPNQSADAMRVQLYAMQLKELELGVRLPEQHPEVVRLREQIGLATASLAKEDKDREQITHGPNRTYEEVNLTLLKLEPVVGGLKAKVEALRNQLAQARADLERFNSHYLALNALQREVSLQETCYRKYLENLEQGQIDQALKKERISNISIAQPASYEFKPARPNVPFNLGVGFLFAVVSSVAVACAADFRRVRHAPQQVEQGPQTPALLPTPDSKPAVIR
jgi:uncharacterized protein involved in exopolysaccharide biosynthesis